MISDPHDVRLLAFVISYSAHFNNLGKPYSPFISAKIVFLFLPTLASISDTFCCLEKYGLVNPDPSIESTLSVIPEIFCTAAPISPTTAILTFGATPFFNPCAKEWWVAP